MNIVQIIILPPPKRKKKRLTKFNYTKTKQC